MTKKVQFRELMPERNRCVPATPWSDVPFLLDRSIAEFGGRPDRAGITRASFGGWTSLLAPALDSRIKVGAAMCPCLRRALLEGDVVGALVARGIDAVQILGQTPAPAAEAAT